MKNINKPICEKCINREICRGECPPVQWINGTKARREPLVNDILAENINNEKNYNEIIGEISGDRQQKMSRILEIADQRDKLIMLALMAGYLQNEISDCFKISLRQIYNIKSNIRDVVSIPCGLFLPLYHTD